jgi:fluoride exporter
VPTILLAIFAGGALGAVARYGLAGWVYLRLGSRFPWGTLAVNTFGSLALGLVLPLLDLRDPATAASGLVTVGFLGAFTTFSTFAYEALELSRTRGAAHALLYAVLSVLLGLGCIAAGLRLAALLAA